MPNNSQMPQFFQVLYGIVIGVSSFKIINSFEEVFPVLSSAGKELIPTLATEIFFLRVLLLFSTILIAAHDWFTFHKDEAASPLKEKFWWNVPQIFSLVFLAQMMLAAVNGDTFFWFAGGLFYTLCNILNIPTIENAPSKKVLFKIYSIHVFLTTACLLILGIFKMRAELWLHYFLVVVIMTIVILLWAFRDKALIKARNTSQKADANVSVPTGQSDEIKQVLNCKNMLAYLNKIEQKDIDKQKNMILFGTLGLLLSLVIIGIVSMKYKLSFNDIFELFCSAGFIGTCATTIYLILTENEINTRNVTVQDQIIKQIDDSIPIDNEFYLSMMKDKFEKMMNEKVKNPLQV